jgi:heme exporter protein A
MGMTWVLMQQSTERLTLLADNLAQSRGGRLLFEHLSFSVKPTETLLLTGPNGSGKTTLLRTLAGYLRPTTGHVRLDGSVLEQNPAEQCHFVGHLNALKSQFTVQENLRFWAQFLAPAAQADPVETALNRLDLTDIADIPAGYLSAGQKRRLGLARLLLAPRAIWLLDEPTAALDASSATALEMLISEHTNSGGLAVIATHLPLSIPRLRELRLGLQDVA